MGSPVGLQTGTLNGEKPDLEQLVKAVALVVHRLTTLLQEVSLGPIFLPKAPVGPHKKSLRLSELVLGFVHNVFSGLLLAHHACRKQSKKPGINTKAETTGTASTPHDTTQLTLIVFDDLD